MQSSAQIIPIRTRESTCNECAFRAECLAKPDDDCPAAGLEIQVTDGPGLQDSPSIYRNKVVWRDQSGGNDDIYIINLPCIDEDGDGYYGYNVFVCNEDFDCNDEDPED